MTLCDLLLIMWWTFNNIMHLIIYILKKKQNSTFHAIYMILWHIWHFMHYVRLTCPQDHCLSDWTRCDFFLSRSGNIKDWRSYNGFIFLLIRYVFCACELFSINLTVFAINNFRKQLYVKYREYLVEAAIWEIVECSTCWKQSEYFEKRDAARFLACYIYNGALCSNSLTVDRTNS